MVADTVGVDPDLDPILHKKMDPDPTVKKNTRIRPEPDLQPRGLEPVRKADMGRSNARLPTLLSGSDRQERTRSGSNPQKNSRIRPEPDLQPW